MIWIQIEYMYNKGLKKQQNMNPINITTGVTKAVRGVCYPVCGMVYIKEPLLLIGKSSLCGGSGFPFSLSEWSLTMSDAI